MVKITAATLLTTLSCVAAYPGILNLQQRSASLESRAAGLVSDGKEIQKRAALEAAALEFQKRDYVLPPPRTPLTKVNRPNTGLPPSGFNAKDQYVDVTDSGPHPWKAPGPNDTRGQCPGLNAAANHGFLDRSGITTITQAVEGLGAAYNMGTDLTAFLAVLATGLSGDPLTQRWSIGKGFDAGVLGENRGLFGLHNKYEGDASIMRGDAYLNNGQVGVLQMSKFEHMYSLGETFGWDEAANQQDWGQRFSEMNNPYYFSAPFSGLVAPAATGLVINLMSNHSEEVPGGTLTRETLMSFFSVTGTPGNFKWNPGYERIPDNWYRRPTIDAHNIPEVLIDLFADNAAYPGIVKFGGNTGKVNSFAGVDLGDLTGGVFNLGNLAQGNNGACFLLEASLAVLPDALDPVLGAVGSILGWATSQLKPVSDKLGCPQLLEFDNTLFNQFPGYGYAPKGY